jgi:hypothetical protein
MNDRNSGRDPEPGITGSPGPVAPLADALAALGQEVAHAQQQGLSELEVYEIEGEFSVAVTEDAQGRLGVWVVGIDDATEARPASHRVKFRLSPRYRGYATGSSGSASGGGAIPSDGEPFEVGEPAPVRSWDEGGRPG